MKGVYADSQAVVGKDVYAGLCSSCHTVSSHTGSLFMSSWTGKPLAELYIYIIETMPKDNPGSLTPKEYIQVLAYLLQINGMPAGKEALVADTLELKKIRVDTVVAGSRENRVR